VGDCVTLGFDFIDSDSIDFSVTLDGEFTGDVIISPDEDNSIEIRENGLWAQDLNTETQAAEVICGPCDEDEENNSVPITGIPTSCNGLQVRNCEGTDCDEEGSGPRLGAPPPIEAVTFTGTDDGEFKFSPLAAGQDLNGGTGESSGIRESNGIVIRSIPHTSSGGSTTTGLNFAMSNDWCTRSVVEIWSDGSAGTLRFEDEGEDDPDDWTIAFYQRAWVMEPNGDINIRVGDAFRVSGAQQPALVDNQAVVSFCVPGIRMSRNLAGTEITRFRFELVMYILSSGSNAVTFPDKPSLRATGIHRTIHRFTSENVGDLST